MSTLPLLHRLHKQLAHCLNQDRHHFKRQLDRLRSEAQKGRDIADKLAALALRVEQSVQAREKRLASVPVLEFPDLPVSGKKDEIARLIEQHQVVVVCGETGSGKTTQLPKICLSIGRGAYGFIGHTQPRRIAARTVADRIAEELHEPLGRSVGYKVRFHDQTRPESLIKLMTDGILLAEIQNDPYLSQYDTLIIDEAHERSLNIDFLLGYLKGLLPKRRDLKLIITSATIDPQRFSKHFDDAPIIEVSGRTYPVEIRYRPIEQSEEEDETSGDLQQAILDAVDELHRDMRGDILIFLSGENEIRETTESLRKHHPAKCEILPLYSKLSIAEQEQVFKPKGQLRIVLATNVAETSLTVPGIRCVIDTGHARISRYSHRSKIQRLPIEKISQASANQRAGRCGRVAEGICIRLYSKEDFLARPEFTEPEILRTNLAAVILQMKTLKLADIEDFPFVEPPESKMIRDGLNMLHEVHALDKQGNLTDTGRHLAKLPIDPKLARMLLEADKQHCLSEVAIIVSGLSIQDPREKPADKLPQAEQKHSVFRAEDSDFLSFLNLWAKFEEQKKHLSNNKLRGWCRDNFISYIRMREWQDVHAQIQQVIKGELKLKPNMVPANYEEIHRALLTGLLSNIGFRHEQYEYLGARNLKFFIFPGSGQHKVRPKWLMAAEQVETSKVYARNVAKIEPEWIEACAEHLIKRSYYDPHWEKKAGRAAVHERTTLYGLTLQAGRKVPYERVDPAAAREMFLRFALVQHEFHTNAAFFRANQQLLEDVGTLQHKGRRVDLVEDEEWLYRFYAQKIPEDVVNGPTFEQWRKKAERDNPKLLFLTREDLTREEQTGINERDFPDNFKVGRLTLSLQYRFEPGHEEDGVTAIVPVHQLNQLTPQPFDWLVPGMLKEKLQALIKSLPKNLRKHFVPVPQTVDQCLEIEPDGTGLLYDWLAGRLRKLTGESIPLNAWNLDLVPEHLKMNYRVVGEDGQLLDFGRDLKALQQKHRVDAGRSFDRLAANELNFTGCVQWAFDDLPETKQFIQDGQTFIGYPAIIDEGDSVGLKMLDTADKSAVAHRAGLVRLYLLALRKDIKYLEKTVKVPAELDLSYQRLAPHPVIESGAAQPYSDDLLAAVIAEVFVRDGAIRSQAEFDRRLAVHKSELFNAATAAGDKARQILQLYLNVQKKLIKWPSQDEAVADIAEQLAHLIYRGFLRRTPHNQLAVFPRYLQAIDYRLDKMGGEKAKDAQKMHEVRRFQVNYWKSVAKRAKSQVVIPEQEPFRWMLEEFRVSLFAQQLKTAYPVSAQRLEKAFNASSC
ncbi:MAG: ATP-dependent RNA helicase HrpA [Gammaproteobacteria bacterium]